jgi:hypothetical protein
MVCVVVYGAVWISGLRITKVRRGKVRCGVVRYGEVW